MLFSSICWHFSNYIIFLLFGALNVSTHTWTFVQVLTGTGSENEFSSYAKLILFHETLKGHKYIMEKVLSVMNIAVKCWSLAKTKVNILFLKVLCNILFVLFFINGNLSWEEEKLKISSRLQTAKRKYIALLIVSKMKAILMEFCNCISYNVCMCNLGDISIYMRER